MQIVKMLGRSVLATALCTAPASLMAKTPLLQGKHGGVDGFDVTHYDVQLTPDIKAKAVRGRETITLNIGDADLKALEFSPNALAIKDAKLNGRKIAVTSDESAIRFTPTRALRRGSKVTLSFAFEGTPKRGLNAVPGGIYSSYFACDWMICRQNSPGDKALLTLSMTVAKEMKTLGPGVLVKTKNLSGGQSRQTWRTLAPYSSYLFGFAVGPFREERVQDSTGTWVYLDATGAGHDLKQKFAATPEYMKTMAELAGQAPPNRPYTQLLVPEYEAQEAASYSLIGVDALDRDLADPGSEWILVHEAAHQWWGNWVTCATWQDFWLNEGMATYMTAVMLERRHGKAAYQAEIERAETRLASAREKGFDKPLRWDGKYPSLGVRRAVQYSKGTLFLNHLRGVMGDAPFWAGIKQFTTTNAGGTVTSMDFERAMQSATSQDLSPLFREWVYGA